MKNKIFCLLACLHFLGGACAGDEVGWYVEKSTHFLIYYKSAPGSFIRELADKSEDYYNKIADGLGFRRMDFWLWDNRAKIYIYDNAQEYQSSTGQAAWSGGCTMPYTKTIHSYPYAKGFMETVLPHEMGHIIFREFVGFRNPAIPLWLEEGIACYQEKDRHSAAKAQVKPAIDKGTLMSLEQLAKFNLGPEADNVSINLFYAESFLAVDYLIKQFGTDTFITFCQELRDQKDFDRALKFAYPFQDLREFDLAWQRYINE